jgi:Bacteriophage tail sheath protein
MPEYLTPGVYYELLDTAPPLVRGVRTDVAAFVGLAPRGPLHMPVRIESWRSYQAIFGSFVSYGYLAYAVKGFLENGGTTCFVVRVAGSDAAAASVVLKNAAGRDLLRIEAKNPGIWGHTPRLSLTTRLGRYTIAVTGPDGEREVHRDLSLDEDDPRFIERILESGDERVPPSRWISATVLAAQEDLASLPDFAVSGLESFAKFALAGGADGLASLTRDDFLGTLDDAEIGKRGLGSLEAVSEVAIVAMPDMHIIPAPPPPKPDLPPPPPVDPCRPCSMSVPASAPAAEEEVAEMPPRFSAADVFAMQRALIEHCELRGDRVAILDAPVHDSGSAYDVAEILDWRTTLESDRGFAALYYPWVKVLDPLKLGGSPVRAVPPSGHIAGLYARTDVDPGVHKAPANGEARWSEDVTFNVEAETQGVLNPEGVNCLRAFPGRGIIVYGARTLSPDPDWCFVNIRRLLLMIEKAVDLSTQWAVFEPHDEVLRQKVVQSISGFLESIWKRGMLAGATKDEAFFVKCDETNNPPQSVDDGRIVTDVGVAAAAPAEFIVFRIGRTVGELETVER